MANSPLPSRGFVKLISMAALVGLIGLTVVTVWTTTVTQHTEPPPNPFTTFTDILPGHSKSAVHKRGFSCYGNPFTAAVNEDCTLELVSGSVTQVQVAIVNDVIDSTTFVIRENAVRLGDFEVFLGTPEIRRFGNVLKFLWRNRGVTVIALDPDKKSDNFLPLWSASFTRTG